MNVYQDIELTKDPKVLFLCQQIRKKVKPKKEQKLTYFALVKATLVLLSQLRKPIFPPRLGLTIGRIDMSSSTP